MLHFTEDDVRRLLPMDEAIGVMRDAFKAYAAGEAQNQPRRRLCLKTGAMLHQLAGATPRYFGAKIYSTHPKFGAWFTVLLYDAETANPLAQLEANHLGQIRTGAASGLATDLLAPRDASRLGIIGSGFQARSQLDAMLAVRQIREVKVWSRKEASRHEFAEQTSAAYGIDVKPVGTAEEAVSDTHIVVTATYAKQPVFRHEWLPKVVHINAMGSNQPDRAEVPAETVRSATLIVADDIEQCRIEAGDLKLALDENGWNRVVPLAEIVTRSRPENENGQPRLTIFKSVGLGLEDIAAAGYIFEKAGGSR